MQRDDMIEIIQKFYDDTWEWQSGSRHFADKLLKEVEKYMEPKYLGKHQDSYSIAMGNRYEWDKK